MRKIMKRAFAAVIVAVMVLCAAPLSGIADFITTAQAAGGYRVGDTLYFGCYPQREITDSFEKTKIIQNSMDNKDVIISYDDELYYREGNRIFEYSPIQWQVMAVDKDRIYVLSSKILDNRQYHNLDSGVTWAGCTLRTWLNNSFYNLAFSNSEKENIITTHLINDNYKGISGGTDTYDKVWLPSFDAYSNKSAGLDSAS